MARAVFEAFSAPGAFAVMSNVRETAASDEPPALGEASAMWTLAPSPENQQTHGVILWVLVDRWIVSLSAVDFGNDEELTEAQATTLAGRLVERVASASTIAESNLGNRIARFDNNRLRYVADRYEVVDGIALPTQAVAPDAFADVQARVDEDAVVDSYLYYVRLWNGTPTIGWDDIFVRVVVQQFDSVGDAQARVAAVADRIARNDSPATVIEDLPEVGDDVFGYEEVSDVQGVADVQSRLIYVRVGDAVVSARIGSVDGVPMEGVMDEMTLLAGCLERTCPEAVPVPETLLISAS